MVNSFFRNTKTMESQLKVFFLSIALAMGIICTAIITISLDWAEDKMLDKRFTVEFQEACEYFKNHKNVKEVKLNSLTTAYNGFEYVPLEFTDYLKETPFYEEVWVETEKSIYLYSDKFIQANTISSVVLVAPVEPLEMTDKEQYIAIFAVLAVVLFFFFLFNKLLSRLSKSFIDPFNQLCTQLNDSQVDTEHTFSMANNSMEEFQTLVDKLNEYNKKMNTLFRREQAFARYTSHELRTPLTLIKGATKLLEKNEAKTPSAVRQINRIYDATNQISHVVEVMLSLVRYERNEKDSHQYELTKEKLQDIISKYEDLAKDKQINLNANIQANAIVNAPCTVLDIVLGNLIRNAINSTPAMENKEIIISMTQSSLEIIDQGFGLNESNNQSNECNKKSGFGLGLLIVEDLCSRYKWSFNLQNNANMGCIAKIIFTNK